jgi:DNA-binding Lrp family transcriptional regulator
MSRACIPFHILFDKDLSKNELLIYGMIEHLESDGKSVFFNNRTIAEKLGISHESGNVRKMISHLTEKGYIKREHKEVRFKRKGNIVSEWRWCFNTVKSNLIHVENDDQGGVAQEPPHTGVAQEPPHTGVAQEPPYTNPSFTNPLTTTTTTVVSSIFSEEKDTELLALRNKHLPRDERSNEEFLKQCKFHIESGDKKYTLFQREAGLKNLICKGFFQAPTNYPVAKVKSEQEIERLKNQWLMYYNSRVEIDCRSRGYPSKTYEEWMEANAQS